jgi:hypothetical protein
MIEGQAFRVDFEIAARPEQRSQATKQTGMGALQ